MAVSISLFLCVALGNNNHSLNVPRYSPVLLLSLLFQLYLIFTVILTSIFFLSILDCTLYIITSGLFMMCTVRIQ